MSGELALAVFASETGTHLVRPPTGARYAAHVRGFDGGAYEQRLAAAGLRFVGRGAAVFPGLLRSIHDPPPGLFLRGAADPELLSRPAVAVVGARACSGYGAAVARSLARDLAAAGLVVVSGLARGIDAEAHRGALEAGGTTVAVLGCGIDRDYPAAHRELAHRIAETGLIVSEYAPGVEPAPWRFPARNRIVAGLCAATVVVEARERSGALITADLALEEGREVFAVPGEITSSLSAGTNDLLEARRVAADERGRRALLLRDRGEAGRRAGRGRGREAARAAAGVTGGRRRARPPRRASTRARWPARSSSSSWRDSPQPRTASTAQSVSTGNADVPVLVRAPLLLLGQHGPLHRCHERPVPADRAALESPPAEPGRLHGRSRNPDRGEQMPLPAANDDIAGRPVAAHLQHGHLGQDAHRDPDQLAGPRPRPGATALATGSDLRAHQSAPPAAGGAGADGPAAGAPAARLR